MILALTAFGLLCACDAPTEESENIDEIRGIPNVERDSEIQRLLDSEQNVDQRAAIEYELRRAARAAQSNPEAAARSIRRSAHRTAIYERELERVDADVKRQQPTRRHPSTTIATSSLITAAFQGAEGYRTSADTFATNLVAASSGETRAELMTVLDDLELGPVWAQETCPSAPSSSLTRVYATDTTIRIRVRSACENVDEWRLYRARDNWLPGNFDFFEVGNGTSLSAWVRDTDLNPDTEYCYFAIAANQHGSATSEQLCIRTGVRQAPPAAPSGVRGSPPPTGDPQPERIQVSWEDNSDNEHGFVIGRALGSEGDVILESEDRSYEFAYYVDSTRPAEMERWVFSDTDPLRADSYYCYYVYAHNPWGGSEADLGCTWTNPKKPEAAVFDQWNIESDRLTVRIGATNADWYRVFVTSGGQVIANEVYSPNDARFVYELNDLELSTEYCIEVDVVNHPREASPADFIWGPSTTECATTTALPEPTVVSRTVGLEQQPIGVDGPIPFLAVWPPFGVLNARLLEITAPNVGVSSPYILHFVKPGYSTADCNNPSAVVSIPGGTTSTPSQLTAIFGSSTPHTPLTFLACVTSAQFLTTRPINIRYQPD